MFVSDVMLSFSLKSFITVPRSTRISYLILIIKTTMKRITSYIEPLNFSLSVVIRKCGILHFRHYWPQQILLQLASLKNFHVAYMPSICLLVMRNLLYEENVNNIESRRRMIVVETQRKCIA